MLSQSIQDALNDQINAEMYSAYKYFSMSAYFESINLHGFAAWMRVQAREEVVHAMKIYDFINDRGGRVILKSIDAPQTEWDSPLDAFEDTYKHEQEVTKRIYNLMDLGIKEKDHAVNTFLQWFVTEQVEEEANTSQLVDQLKLVKDAPSGLFMLDRDLGNRQPEAGE